MTRVSVDTVVVVVCVVVVGCGEEGLVVVVVVQTALSDTRVCPGAHETCCELERSLTCGNRDQPTPKRGKRVGEMPSSQPCTSNPGGFNLFHR